MKKAILLLALIAGFASCKKENPQPNPPSQGGPGNPQPEEIVEYRIVYMKDNPSGIINVVSYENEILADYMYQSEESGNLLEGINWKFPISSPSAWGRLVDGTEPFSMNMNEITTSFKKNEHYGLVLHTVLQGQGGLDYGADWHIYKDDELIEIRHNQPLLIIYN